MIRYAVNILNLSDLFISARNYSQHPLFIDTANACAHINVKPRIYLKFLRKTLWIDCIYVSSTCYRGFARRFILWSVCVEGLLVSLGLDIDNVATTVMYSRIDLNGDWQKKKNNKKTSKIAELKSSTLENHLYEPSKYVW